MKFYEINIKFFKSGKEIFFARKENLKRTNIFWFDTAWEFDASQDGCIYSKKSAMLIFLN